MRKAETTSYTPALSVNEAAAGSLAAAIVRYRRLSCQDITELPDDEAIEALDRAVDAAADEIARQCPRSQEDVIVALDFALEVLGDYWDQPPMVVGVLRNLRRALTDNTAVVCHPG